jgi:hypothetical protein
LQEGDYLVDSLIIFLLMSLLVYGGRGAKTNWQYLIVVVLCIKGSYWFDREESMNSKVDVKLKGVKDAIQ